MKPVSIEVRNLSHVFASERVGENRVLDNIQFSMDPHERFALVGPSGCGKSTLLSLLAGFISRQKGTISIGGRPVDSPSADRILLSQDFSLFDWKTALGNVVFGLKAKGMSKADREKKAMEFLQRVGLADYANYFPSQMSGGMRQRVAFARAMSVEPDILLLDEPFGALDWATRRGMHEEFLELWLVQKPSVILVTHDVDEAIRLGHRVAVLSRKPSSICFTCDVRGFSVNAGSAKYLHEYHKTRVAIEDYLTDS